MGPQRVELVYGTPIRGPSLQGPRDYQKKRLIGRQQKSRRYHMSDAEAGQKLGKWLALKLCSGQEVAFG